MVGVLSDHQIKQHIEQMNNKDDGGYENDKHNHNKSEKRSNSLLSKDMCNPALDNNNSLGNLSRHRTVWLSCL